MVEGDGTLPVALGGKVHRWPCPQRQVGMVFDEC